MAQHGYTNTVATMGTACTLNHLKLLARYANELYVVYDGDSAGQHAILKLTELCWQVALTLKIIRLPEGHDPDSFLSAGNDLKSSIAAAQDIFFFFIESTGKDFAQKTVHEKVALSKHLLTIIKTIEDTFTKDLLLQQTAKTLDIPFETLKHELRRTRPPVEQNGSVERTPETNPEDYPIGTLEKKIFCAILYKVTLLRENHHKMLIHHIPEPYKAILKRRLDEHAQHKLIDFSLFFAQLNAAEQRVVSKALFEEAVDTDDETFDQLVVYLHRKQWKTMVKEITREIQQAKNQGDEERVQGLLQDFLALKQKIVPHVQNNTEKGDI
jgi:DNA primase